MEVKSETFEGEGFVLTLFEDETGEMASVKMDEFGGSVVSKEKLLESIDLAYAVSTLVWHSRRSREVSEVRFKIEWEGRMNRYNKIREDVKLLL